ncbi:MAG: hypothetical protein HRU22_13445 [Gammaproteobacteria bacterium]|nr:hypothetical protein [Gammaproteobacteria bacterium]
MKSTTVLKVVLTLSLFAAMLLWQKEDRSSTKDLIKECLTLNDVVANAIKKNQLNKNSGAVSGTINGINLVSYQYQNFKSGFKGVCSDNQFSFANEEIIGVKDNQNFIFIQSSSTLFPESKKYSENIWYSLVSPQNIELWLKEKI